MKKKLILMLALVAMACLLTLVVSAAPEKPDLGVSFGATQTIDTIVPPSQKYVDTTERVLLYDGTEYATYPTYYITKNSTTFEMTFDAINATGKSYDATSVVMVEAPTGITHFKAYTFSGYTNVLYCKVPGTVVKYGGGSWSAAFESCSWIRMIEFVDGETPLDNTMFGSNMFAGCSSLEYVKLPNNLKTTGGALFNNCKSLKTVIFGMGFETLPSSGGNFAGSGNSAISHKDIYISAAFGGENVSLNNGMFVWTSNQNSDDGPRMIFYYTGTREQAEALQAKALTTTNNGKLAYATIVSKDDFVRANADAKKNYIVYGYNSCEIFYGGHTEGQILNSCQFGCGRNCGKVELLENPQHNLSKATTFGEAGYFAESCTIETCSVCKTETLNATVGAIFVDYGYSMTEAEINGKLSMSQFYGVNKENLAAYTKATGKSFEYGIVVSIDGDPMNNEKAGLIANNQTYITPSNKFNQDYSAFAVVVSGFIADEGNATVDKVLTFCAYVKDGDSISYLDNGTTVETVEMKSYNDVKALLGNKTEVTE